MFLDLLVKMVGGNKIPQMMDLVVIYHGTK